MYRAASSRFVSTTTTTTTTNDKNEIVDVVIVGGGVAGSSLARQLAAMNNTNDLSIALVEAGPGPSRDTDVSKKKEWPHPRSYALSPSSLDILGLLKNNDDNINDNDNNINPLQQYLTGGYYNSMQIWEAGQPASLLFTQHDLDHSTNNNNNNNNTKNQYPHLGCCVEDSVLQEYLWKELKEKYQDNVRIYPHTKLQDFTLPTSGIGSGLVNLTLNHNNNNNEPTTTTTTQTKLSTKLLVAADGANSQIRQQSGISVSSYDYGQTALTFTVELADGTTTIPPALRRRAFQRFLTTGPLALLPTYSDRHAVIVWSTTPTEVQKWKNHPDLVHYMNDLLQMGPQRLEPLFYKDDQESSSSSSLFNNVLYGIDKVIDTIQYGTAMAVQQGPLSAAASYSDPHCVFQAPPRMESIVSPQFAFPLKCQLASKHTTGHRLALIGDAGHTVHPMAGQGLNLGLQDVLALSQCIQKAVDSGMDIATFIESDYETGRTQQVTATVSAIHTLQQVFVTQQATVAKHVKSLGMNLIQATTPVRKLLVQAACQGVRTTN